MQTEDLAKELPKGLIKWYPFHKGEKALFVTSRIEEFNVLHNALQECGLYTDCLSLDELRDETKSGDCNVAVYQYIVAVGVLEYATEPVKVLQELRSMLKPCGSLFLGMDNRLGIRYFCGDRDVFTERNFDSIENYTRISPMDREQLEGQAYAKAEIIELLKSAGLARFRFYSVLPALNRPQALYAEDYQPREQLDIRIAPQYHSPDTIFLEEEKLYTTLIQNNLFHTMANGYFIECTVEGELACAQQITVSMDRGEKDALATIIYGDNKVIKKALYPEGKWKLGHMLSNMEDLRKHGIKLVDAKLKEDSFVMPYVEGINATDYFRDLLLKDAELFLQELDRFWALVQASSEHVPYEEVDWEHFDPEWEKRKEDDPNKDQWKKAALNAQEDMGIILARGYIDLVSLNCFYVAGEFVFFDQEFYIENLPANVIMVRTINFIYSGNAQLEIILPRDQLLERYHLHKYIDLWDRFAGVFLLKLRNEIALSGYHQLCRRNIGVMNANRQRMNYSVREYERLFRNIFTGTENREIYLFGSGAFTKQFLSQFGQAYKIAGIFDNNAKRWGDALLGIQIMSPECLHSLEIGTYKVIICIKNYVPVVRQLQMMGVKDYAIYDSSLDYPRKTPVKVEKSDNSEKTNKKYHVGYISGVFDLFHIGHLNLLKRAKELCDYLIVGVVNDESVIKNKRTMPYIPFQERIEIVRACRYVDEAVEIPTEYSGPEEAYRRYQFDVQFMGSDYEDSPWWQAKKEFLQKQGSDMVFFPYTQSVSSTKLKALIEKGLA